MSKNKPLSLLCLVSTVFLSCCQANIVDSSTQTSEVVSSSKSTVIDESSQTQEEVSSVEVETSSEKETTSETQSSVVEETSSEELVSSEEPSYDVNEDFDFGQYGIGSPTVKQMGTLPSYSPTTFKVSTYQTTTKSLGDGVDLVQATFQLNNNSQVSPYCVVVDLKKANIVAGSYNNSTDPASYNTKSTPYAQAVAWENANPGKKVIAATNADYFGSEPVNAFVKDGVILKAAHNSDASDVPVSDPKLFGVSSAGAKIDSMTHFQDYSTNQNSSLKDSGLVLLKSDGTQQGIYGYRQDFLTSDTAIGVMTIKDVQKPIKANAKVYKFKKIQKDQCKDGEIRACLVEQVTNTSLVKITNDDYGYISFGVKFSGNKLVVGDYFSIVNGTVLSDDGIWNYYDTILGARHSLIEEGTIPSTVAKETSNGASYRVPRSAVGVMPDGKVVIVSVEDLHYNSNNGVSTCTGMTLSQLADFMRYFGCYDAANFDGGGSSQLLTKSGLNGAGNYVVTTRSSDTASTTAYNTRPVINTIIVTTK